MYSAVVQVLIYQLAKYKKDPIKMTEKSQNADSGKEIKEKRKDNTTTERSSDLVGRLKKMTIQKLDQKLRLHNDYGPT